MRLCGVVSKRCHFNSHREGVFTRLVISFLMDCRWFVIPVKWPNAVAFGKEIRRQQRLFSYVVRVTCPVTSDYPTLMPAFSNSSCQIYQLRSAGSCSWPQIARACTQCTKHHAGTGKNNHRFIPCCSVTPRVNIRQQQT
jgi:hypothetical protein